MKLFSISLSFHTLKESLILNICRFYTLIFTPHGTITLAYTSFWKIVMIKEQPLESNKPST